ncbi:ADP-forming succinate--CoA ligase subunit beta [bacterium (Candidatus Blackallbacteria) CG17_big_fil_post_rev_8_21_14_2_50_48_46]|uniref:Succinate--CoA ligase [ADP-forming] subunit beta n=1 Tax=bacterium (Candidatus Blackallbacteria) CG17_big_fil_post_rev_8_21_14_2_50_48_46 TaxID=2014261 RepID=A0A2M7G4V4_9BACT|nr:MAG: ADP-forming succinate--CoA ligase subunit beta [bacterium (Candidatus Blackallbacteria) CG18_big_fil_WC_8_21_14_2_50_49_26]PIW16811.1 MAG: ADP-forming succinate--CoA ligase subunit beta [bacterium (Candidatus Blackallbacteria) CG17_big_fil_post_rev_8_21_14_2_50_48_46]PIW48008.1 MAG: ADP-forming succinate--CoA ligase subunit beta [bacterium (Candidatus Blackallbacteria) CG13_big_fil_rev_8_21_14_2_50_49_14]
MKLHEFQAKEVFAKHGLRIPHGIPAFSVEEVKTAVAKLSEANPNLQKVVLKSQVHVGGRGKAGGIKVVNLSEAESVADKLFGMDIKGLPVRKLLVEEAINIAKEYYVGLTLDRTERKTILMASSMGGVDIEEVAVTHPEAIVKVWIDPNIGLTDYQIKQVVFGAELPAEAANFIKVLYQIYTQHDCSIAEINPLIKTAEGEVIAGDAKIDIDDNALFRHADLTPYQDPAEVDPNELDAKKAGLTYIELDGNIGCVVNGAGLAMATMDAVKYAGGQPANFLDIGGSSNPDKVTAAMQILKRKNVKGILFNIFGGITRCDDVAKGIITALDNMGGLDIPIVIRLTGTNEELAREMLTDKGFKVGSSMGDAVKEIIELTKG